MASTILFSLNQTYLYEKNYLLLCLLYATKIRPASVNACQGTLKNFRNERRHGKAINFKKPLKMLLSGCH
ncbi:hypothetical protein BC643_1969 [Mangrovibacterium diazotrophicum]|uniref:Uncharacterized protein n=1 Tax=Mangrovibacterium diazotrophicum TaxID=1261403 RepID=A0A419W801_9BACT|nr:hypothetical protein BC643_1969 [Mangrovibacterium diazotrophicum]